MNIFKNASKTCWFTSECMKWRETWDAIYEAEKALMATPGYKDLEEVRKVGQNEKI